MKRISHFGLGHLVAGCVLAIAAGAAGHAVCEPAPAAVADFHSYVATVEARLAQEHSSRAGFLAPEDMERLRRGELIIEQLTPAEGEVLPGALLHDWRGTAFVPGASAAEFQRVMQDYSDYPRRYAPQVVRAKVISHQGEHFQVQMRVRQRHVITVVMDTTYEIAFGRLDADHGYSLSHSTHIAEIASPGTAKEHALSPAQAHGFLWRMNTYWSYEQRDGGLYIQVESVTLTRSIPTGLGWVVGPFVKSIPRDSLEFTLRATRDALRR